LRAAAVLAVASILFVAAFGCGSSDDSTGTEAPAPDVARGASGDAGAAQADAGGKPKGGGKAAGGATGSDGARSKGADDSASPPNVGRPNRNQGQDASGRSRAIRRAAAKHCPDGIDIPRCEALVEDYAQSEDTPSYEILTPRDCAKALSKEDCEAIYEAQKQAAEAAAPAVEYEKCVRNPTPRCEAILGPVLEQQQAQK